MKEFLNKYIYLTVQKEKILMHKCALVTSITDIHISILDNFDNNSYMYRIADIIDIKISNKEVKKW